MVPVSHGWPDEKIETAVLCSARNWVLIMPYVQLNHKNLLLCYQLIRLNEKWHLL